MPRLTVLMPMRNASRTVKAALTSTLRALPKDAEIVIHDDASTDDSASFVDRLRDRRLRLLRSEARIGVSEGLNRLLASADCSVVARMDADDVCLPWRFRVQIPRLEHIDVSFGQAVYFGEARRRLRPTMPLHIPHDALPLHLVISNPLIHSSMVGRRDAISAVGGYREVPAEDFELWMRLVAEGYRLERVATPVVLYRQHSGQVTAAAQWNDRRSIDAATLGSYNDMCRVVLGRDPSWLPNPWRYPQTKTALEEMATSIRERSLRLSRTDRWLLDRKSRKAIGAAAVLL